MAVQASRAALAESDFSPHNAACTNTSNETEKGKPSAECWSLSNVSLLWFKMHGNRQNAEQQIGSVCDLTITAGRIIQAEMNPV